MCIQERTKHVMSVDVESKGDKMEQIFAINLTLAEVTEKNVNYQGWVPVDYKIKDSITLSWLTDEEMSDCYGWKRSTYDWWHSSRQIKQLISLVGMCQPKEYCMVFIVAFLSLHQDLEYTWISDNVNFDVGFILFEMANCNYPWAKYVHQPKSGRLRLREVIDVKTILSILSMRILGTSLSENHVNQNDLCEKLGIPDKKDGLEHDPSGDAAYNICKYVNASMILKNTFSGHPHASQK